MMIREYRERLAPLMGRSSVAILGLQKKNHGLMRAEAPPDAGFGTGHAIEATPINGGIVFLAVLDGARMEEITERTERLWRARFAVKGELRDACPVTGARTCGEAIVALIEQPELGRKLDRIELHRGYLTIELLWNDDTRSMFHPFASGNEWRKRVFEIVSAGPTRTHRLEGSVFAAVAALIEGGGAAQP